MFLHAETPDGVQDRGLNHPVLFLPHPQCQTLTLPKSIKNKAKIFKLTDSELSDSEVDILARPHYIKDITLKVIKNIKSS